MNGKNQALGRLKRGIQNKTEAAYARVLELRRMGGEIAWFAFEGITFKLADDTRYTPDFAVMLADGTMEMHEVKGSLDYIQDDAKVKIKVANDMFPFRFFLVAPIAKKRGGGWQTKEIGNVRHV